VGETETRKLHINATIKRGEDLSDHPASMEPDSKSSSMPWIPRTRYPTTTNGKYF